MKKDLALKRAKELLEQMNDPMHPVSHMESVWNYAKEIAAHYLETNLDLLEVAVWWHDVGRQYTDLGHAAKSAEIADVELSQIGYDKKFINDVCHAIASHSNKDNLKPATLEAKILKDADKLDFLTVSHLEYEIDNKIDKGIRIGIKKIPIVRNHILSLEPSKQIFDRLFIHLKKFAKNDRSNFFDKYRDDVLNMVVKQ